MADFIGIRRQALAEGVTGKKLTKLSTYWQLLRNISQYAGYAAKTYMDRSFMAAKNTALSTVRFNISGSSKAVRWNQAVQPSAGQRQYGSKGEPRYKRKSDGFAWQETDTAGKIIREKRRKKGYQIYLKPLPDGLRWTDMAYHRPLPDNGIIKQITVNEKAGRYFAVFSVGVPDDVWAIEHETSNLYAGIDPGAQTALTISFKHAEAKDNPGYIALHYQFLEKSLDKLEKLQTSLVQKQGPKRKMTEEEVNTALVQFSNKASIRRLPPVKAEAVIEKERKRLQEKMVHQDASKRWKRWMKRVQALHLKIANQRLDVLHKASRALVENFDVIGIGDWEPEREVSYRKKLRRLKKQVNRQIEGAAEELKKLQEDKSKQGPKGVKKRRRGGRDRSIATFRSFLEEKGERAGVKVYPKVREAGSTKTCSSCGEMTGPSGQENLSVRVWQCDKCGTVHNRDVNASLNIIKRIETELSAAQAAASATGLTVTRTTAQGAKGQPESGNGFRLLATGLSGRGSSLSLKHGPKLFESEVTGSLKSLLDMGVVHPLPMQMAEVEGSKGPP